MSLPVNCCVPQSCHPHSLPSLPPLAFSAPYSTTNLPLPCSSLCALARPNFLLFPEHAASFVSSYFWSLLPTLCLVSPHFFIEPSSPPLGSFQGFLSAERLPPSLTLLDCYVSHSGPFHWTCCPYLWDPHCLLLTPQHLIQCLALQVPASFLNELNLMAPNATLWIAKCP